MTLLTLVQNVANEVGITEPETVVGNTDTQVKQLLRLVYRTGDNLKRRFDWPQLTKEHSITLVASDNAYAFPDDYERQLYNTHWDDTNNWALIGPISPQEWQWRTKGIVASFPRFRFRARGDTDDQILLTPTPGTGDAGNILYFEYQSTVWIKPTVWEEAKVFSDGDYCFYNGNYYSCTTGGTAGATPPTHTSSTASDDTITWTYVSDPYLTFVADTDEVKIDQSLIELGVAYRFLRQKGLNYQHLQQEFEHEAGIQSTALRGARTVSWQRGGGNIFISAKNIPDSGFGV